MDLLGLSLSYYSNFTFKDVGIGAEEGKPTKNLLISALVCVFLLIFRKDAVSN
jgi:hypothetical protein